MATSRTSSYECVRLEEFLSEDDNELTPDPDYPFSSVVPSLPTCRIDDVETCRRLIRVFHDLARVSLQAQGRQDTRRKLVDGHYRRTVLLRERMERERKKRLRGFSSFGSVPPTWMKQDSADASFEPAEVTKASPPPMIGRNAGLQVV